MVCDKQLDDLQISVIASRVAALRRFMKRSVAALILGIHLSPSGDQDSGDRGISSRCGVAQGGAAVSVQGIDLGSSGQERFGKGAGSFGGDEMQGGATHPVLFDVDVNPFGEQQFNQFPMLLHGSQAQGGALSGRSVRINPAGQKEFDDVSVTSPRRGFQQRVADASLQHIVAARQEKLHNVQMAAFRSFAQGRVARFVSCLQIGAVVKKKLNDLAMAMPRGKM